MPSSPTAKTATAAVLKIGLIAGILDIAFAMAQFYIKTDRSPLIVLRYISKIAFGPTWTTDLTALTITGLLVHFLIAFAWVFLFFIIYPHVQLLQQNKIVTGVVYGSLIWAIMTLAVLPLWNNRPVTIDVETAAIGAAILIVAIGLPTSFMTATYYSHKKKLS